MGGVRPPAPLRRLAIPLLLGVGCAIPSAASAEVYYVTDPGVQQLHQYRSGPGGVLSPFGDSQPAAGSVDRVAVTTDARNVFVGQLRFSGDRLLLFYRLAGDGAASANGSSEEDRPTSVAVHPRLQVMYFSGIGESGYEDTLTIPGASRVFQRPIGGNGRADGDGTMTTANPLAQGPADIALNPAASRLYAAYDSGTLETYELDPATGAIGDTLDSESIEGVESLAVTPDGRSLYAAYANEVSTLDGEGGDVTAQQGEGPGIELFTIGSDGSLTDQGFASLDEFPGEIAVSPDGRNLYVSEQQAHVVQFAIGLSGGLNLLGRTPEPDSGGGANGLTVSPDGRSVYLTTTFPGIMQFDRAGDGTLSPKSPAVVPGSNGGEGEGDPTNIAVRPPQAPIASFGALAGAAGSPTQFNANASSDPDGSVVRWDWSFGDGSSLVNGGPTPTHIYERAGTYQVILRVFDADGTSNRRVYNGRQALRAGSARAIASRGVSVPATGPTPEFGRTVAVEPVLGTVLVRLPGTDEFVPLESLGFIPVGATIDARRGRVRLTVETADGQFESAIFYGSYFAVTQSTTSSARRRRRITQLKLRGRIGSCAVRGVPGDPGQNGRTRISSKRAHDARRRRRRRRLWGRGRGRFRSRGRHASATVRGTTWFVEDRCTTKGYLQTRVFVKSGRLLVRDFRLDKDVGLRTGQRYESPPGRKR